MASDDELEIQQVPAMVAKDGDNSVAVIMLMPHPKKVDGVWFFRCAKGDTSLSRVLGLPYWDSARKDRADYI